MLIYAVRKRTAACSGSERCVGLCCCIIDAFRWTSSRRGIDQGAQQGLGVLRAPNATRVEAKLATGALTSTRQVQSVKWDAATNSSCIFFAEAQPNLRPDYNAPPNNRWSTNALRPVTRMLTFQQPTLLHREVSMYKARRPPGLISSAIASTRVQDRASLVSQPNTMSKIPKRAVILVRRPSFALSPSKILSRDPSFPRSCDVCPVNVPPPYTTCAACGVYVVPGCMHPPVQGGCSEGVLLGKRPNCQRFSRSPRQHLRVAVLMPERRATP